MLETAIKKLTEAVEYNNELLEKQLAGQPCSKGKSTPDDDDLDDDDLDDPEPTPDPDDELEDEPTPAKKKAAKKAPKKKSAKTRKGKNADKTLEDLRVLVRGERERLKAEVSLEAVGAHKKAFRAILDEVGAKSISNIPEDQINEVYKQVSAIDVESSDDLDDDDLD